MPPKTALDNVEDALRLSAQILEATAYIARAIEEVQQPTTSPPQCLTTVQHTLTQAQLSRQCHKRSPSLRSAMHRVSPQKHDKTPRAPTPVFLPLEGGVSLPPASVDPMDNPHQVDFRGVPGQLPTRASLVSSRPSMIRDERGFTHNPYLFSYPIPDALHLHFAASSFMPGNGLTMLTGHTGAPPNINWTNVRRDNSLPLRDYPTNNTVPHTNQIHRPEHIHPINPMAHVPRQPDHRPLGPGYLNPYIDLNHDGSDSDAGPSNVRPRKTRSNADHSPDKMQHESSRKTSGSSEASENHVFTLKGLVRSLKKIWPEDLPRDIEEVKRGLNNAIKEGKLEPAATTNATTTRFQAEENATDDVERNGDGRHRRVETVDDNGSPVRLRHPSPVRNLRERFRSGIDADSEELAASPPSRSLSPSHQPTIPTPLAPHIAHAIPPSSLPHPAFAPTPLVFPPFHPGPAFVAAPAPAITTTATAAAVPLQDNTNSRNAAPHARSRSTHHPSHTHTHTRRESKALRYVDSLYQHIQYHESSRQTQDRIIGELNRTNDGLRGTVLQLQTELAGKVQHLGYVGGVVQNLVNENHQLKMQVQAAGLSYEVRVQAPGSVRMPPAEGAGNGGV